MTRKIDVQEIKQGDIQLLKVRGALDMAEVPGFEQALDDILLRGVKKLVVDLTDLEYISSAGIGALIGRIRDLRQQGGDLKIGGYHPRVFEVMKLIGFTDIFDVYADTETAVSHF